MHNPDVLIEALRGAEDKLTRDADVKATKVLSDRRDEIFDDPATPVGGNPRGDVSIVEFFDYRCPYCKQVLPALQTLLSEDQSCALSTRKCPSRAPIRHRGACRPRCAAAREVRGVSYGQ